jgi:hypothetical protein
VRAAPRLSIDGEQCQLQLPAGSVPGSHPGECKSGVSGMKT